MPYKDPEKQRASQAAWYVAHQAELLVIRTAHREEARAYRAAHYVAHPRKKREVVYRRPTRVHAQYVSPVQPQTQLSEGGATASISLLPAVPSGLLHVHHWQIGPPWCERSDQGRCLHCKEERKFVLYWQDWSDSARKAQDAKSRKAVLLLLDKWE